MRQLGDRNLTIHDKLHPAGIAFFDRHFKRLKRHVEYRSIEGVQNSIHMFLAMVGILRSQVDRLVVGVESKGSELSKDKWIECRKDINTYFMKFRDLLDCLWEEYLSELAQEYPQKALSDAIGPDLESISELCRNMLLFRDRIDVVRTTRLARINNSGRRIIPGYFDDICGPKRWFDYVDQITADVSSVENAVRLVA